jgi:hypothetical protein
MTIHILSEKAPIANNNNNNNVMTLHISIDLELSVWPAYKLNLRPLV